MPPPAGLYIGNPNKPWRIGRLLGSGACGSVHEVEPPPGSSYSSSSFAAKIAPLPKSSGKAKKKKTPEERNADLIVWEHNLMNTHLPELRGVYIPELPHGSKCPPAYGEIDGFRYLVMERMSNPFNDAVPILLESHAGATKIPLGNLAISMLKCIRAIHEKGLIYIDVKPENFMLSKSSSKSGKKKDDLSQRIRLIDFGIMEMLKEMGSHREDLFPGAPLIGTPTYASLNVMSGHTVSRRDDVEALGYVLSELILLLGATTHNSKGKKESVLPWGDAKNDDELLKIKSKEMDESKRTQSKFFGALKAVGADVVMGKYFSAVRKIEFTEKPNYDKLETVLEQLTVSVDGKVAAPKSRTKKTSPKSPRRNTTRQTEDELEDEDRSPEKKQRVAAKKAIITRRATRRAARNNDSDEVMEDEDMDKTPEAAMKDNKTIRSVARKTTRSTREVSTQTFPEEVINVDDSNDNEEEEEAMDWEVIDEENVPPTARASTTRHSAIKLEVIDGPHKGEVVSFGGDHPDTLVIGRQLANTCTRGKMKDAAKLELDADTKASAVHAKVIYRSLKSSHSLRIEDMKSTNGTFINGTQLAKGKYQQVFVGAKVTIGESTFEVKKA